MSLASKLRQHALRLIEADPVRITVTRWVQVARPAGGVKMETVSLEPQTVRVYPRRGVGTAARPRTTDPDRPWALLAPHTADIATGDEFEARGRRFRVAATCQETFRGEVVAVSAELEELGKDAGS